METHDVRLITFPHSGTRTVKRILELNQVSCLHQHFTGDYRNRIIWGESTKPAVVTVKPEEEIRASWVKRYMTGKAHSGQFARMWIEMQEFIASDQEVYVIHLNDPDRRDGEVRLISEVVGKPIIPDWSLRLGANGA